MLSIIIPAYNAERTLGKLLDSILASEGLPEPGEYEILLVDDASTDGTRRVAEEYAERLQLEEQRRGRFLAASPLTVVRQSPNQGPARARNLGVQRSRGDLLLFLDADVALHRDTLRRLL
ncbi:MAG: glycosyltransferase family 2 protein, partial [Candidatus Methylomirabilis sp.]|nr:glycosyltransferase family 2 protein [Deltaproteobacteria bacterium]